MAHWVKDRPARVVGPVAAASVEVEAVDGVMADVVGRPRSNLASSSRLSRSPVYRMRARRACRMSWLLSSRESATSRLRSHQERITQPVGQARSEAHADCRCQWQGRGQDTTLGRVRDLILAAEKTKLPVVRIMDHYMGFYTPLVLCIGALVWTFTHELSRVISVFIVSCPCAFVLASPTAMVAALSAAARLGVLIKNVTDLELAARISAFVFDKTGTLTFVPRRAVHARPAPAQPALAP
jgi:hypothetical protein